MVPANSFPDQRTEVWYAARQVKEAVPQRIDLQVMHAVSKIARTGEYVMLLEHLMQQYAVKEAAQAQPEQDTGGNRKVFLLARLAIHTKFPHALSMHIARTAMVIHVTRSGGSKGTFSPNKLSRDTLLPKEGAS
jgi:hypothetical protein